MTKEKIIEIIKNELECVRTASDNKCDRDCENCKLVRDSDDIIKAYDFVIEMLEQEPCEDCIRRSDVGLTDFEILMCDGDYKEALKMLSDKIEKAPSVTPQPKMGHWIYEDVLRALLQRFS